jgi:IS5 family transposase
VFFYLRHYPTFSELGRQFGITESYANKIYHLVSDILVKLKKVPNRKVLFEGDLEEILVDVTEQQIERPLKKQKDYYSGKKKKHTIKVQLIACSITLRILSVYCEKGSVHDFKIFKDSKLSIASEIKILADSGYQGIEKIHHNSVIPYKKTKKNPLTKKQKQENKELSKKRISVEHINRRCKIFRITKEVYRGKHKNYGKVWNSVSGLVNIRYAA